MIICHIDTKPFSYNVNSLFAVKEGTQFDWAIGSNHKITLVNALLYRLALEWKVNHQYKNTEEKLIECGLRFRMDFDVENEFSGRKYLAGYLYDYSSHVQAIIKVGVPDDFELLKPVKFEYHDNSHIIIGDIKDGIVGAPHNNGPIRYHLGLNRKGRFCTIALYQTY